MWKETLELQPHSQLHAPPEEEIRLVGRLAEVAVIDTGGRITPAHVVEQIEGIHLKLPLQLLRDFHLLDQRAVDIENPRPPQSREIPGIGARREIRQPLEPGSVEP